MLSWFRKSAPAAEKNLPQNLDAKDKIEKESSSWVSSLQRGLRKTASGFGGALRKIVGGRRVDAELLDEIEEILILADVGVSASAKLKERLAARKWLDAEIEYATIQKALQEEIVILLQNNVAVFPLAENKKPYVIMMCGVNGSGKTTTIGKLASHYHALGKKVMVAAADTFRAAAVEQLVVWAERIGIECVSGAEGADPASVAYQALELAEQKDIDVLLIDTAGRLHNKTNLMDQLQKIVRVMQKKIPDAPHSSLLVLDGTVGQNALRQVEIFHAATPLSGLVITKLDGTAKGGVVIGIAEKFAIPIVALGVGEAIEDLQPFDAAIFAQTLLE
jgi:fused signal recognition particle receptor